MFDAMMAKQREERLANSDQLSLGELILKLEAIGNKDLPIFFDDTGIYPTGCGSWRGSYCELGISHTEDGTYDGYFGTEEVKENWGSYFKKVEPKKLTSPTANDFLLMLKDILNKEFEGYKGNEFKMHKGVSVYVSDYSMSHGYKDSDKEDCYSQTIFDVVEDGGKVKIITDFISY